MRLQFRERELERVNKELEKRTGEARLSGEQLKHEHEKARSQQETLRRRKLQIEEIQKNRALELRELKQQKQTEDKEVTDRSIGFFEPNRETKTLESVPKKVDGKPHSDSTAENRSDAA